MGLAEYKRKRDFKSTPEPSSAKPPRKHKQPIFVVQEHHASTHHFDFRLEADGVLKSWAVPKGPSMSPADKRLAVQVEDHPLSYATFEGDIPEGQYGAGHVEIWDHGTYEPEDGSPKTIPDALDKGRLTFTLHGRKLNGSFTLIRTPRPARQPQWLLIKRSDSHANPTSPPVAGASRPRKSTSSSSPTPKIILSKSSKEPASLSHPDKILYPDANLTKQDVADYYRRIAHLILPYLKNRPVTVERYPAGVAPGSPRFWQKNLPKSAPSWIPRVQLPSEQGKPVQYALINDLDTLLWFVNQNALAYHIYLSTVDHLDRPDFVLFDLDPGTRPFPDVITVAKTLHTVLDASDTPHYLKTSGKSGLHILAKPTDISVGSMTYDAARTWAESIANDLLKELPTLTTIQRTVSKRKNRIYIDYIQNALGHHFIAPYSLRATPTATASTPLPWTSLTPKLDPKKYTAQTLPRLLSSKPDPLSSLLL